MKKVLILLFLFIFTYANLSDLQKAAKAGNKEALIKLGFMYENGQGGVEKDLDMAKKYYSQAAELGSEDAQIALSLLQLNSHIDKKSVSLSNSVDIEGESQIDMKLSVDDLKETLIKAKKLDKDALYTLAVIYDNGFGDIKPDKQRAIALYKKAAKMGSKKALKVLELKKYNVK